MLVLDARAAARVKVDSLMSSSGRLITWLAQQVAVESIRQIESAKLTGAMPEEIHFDYEINLKAYLR